MEDINEYIKLPKPERQSHLDLTTECREIGGLSTHFKGMLSHYLDVTIPSGSKIHLCHACHNGDCSNPQHLYYGTPSENMQDRIASGTYQSPWELMVEKYGYEEACRMNGRGNKAAGGKANKGKAKSESHKKAISESIKRDWSKKKHKNNNII